MKSLLLAAVALVTLFGSPLSACLNEYHPDHEGTRRSQEIVEELLLTRQEADPWPVRRDRLRAELAAGGDYRVKNDLAVALAHTGEAAEAIALLEEIEAEHPGLYETASNLGTALELHGENQRALKWIQEGVKRNPESHAGTEWLHVRILQAKLALAENPDWLETHSILGWRANMDQRVSDARDNYGQPMTPSQEKLALIHQLHERLQFVRPPDAIVGDLLFDLATLINLEHGQASALGVARLGNTFIAGLPRVTALQAQGNLWRHYEVRSKPPSTLSRVTRFAPAGLTMFAIIAFVLSFVVIRLKRWLLPSGRR